MKKFLIICVIISFLVCLLSGCNKQIVDLNYTFNYAIIELPNGDIVEGEVQSWKDYKDGDQIQLKINNIVYLVHSTDVALIHK